jgi:hypothetical protein
MTPAQIDRWNAAMRLPDLPPERVGQIMRELGRRMTIVNRLKALDADVVIADD